MSKENFNENDIKKFYNLFHHNNPTEIRVFDPKKYPEGKSIFVKNEDEFVKIVYQLNVIEKVDTYIGGRDRVKRGDNNVVSSFYIFCEIDMHEGDNPELTESFETLLQMNAIKIYIKVFSGGGYHYYIPHQFENLDDNNREKYKQFLYSFRDAMVSKNVNIDTKVFNLERVSRIPGTFNWKRNKLSKITDYDELQPYEIEKNTKNIKKFVDSCVIPKESLTQNITILQLLQEYYIHKNEKWLYEIFDKNIIIKPDTGGNSVVFKNVALLCMQYNMKPHEIEFIGKELTKHCEDRTYTAFCGWVRKIKNNEIGMFNNQEINKWIDEQKYPLSRYIYNKTDKYEVRSLKDILTEGIPKIKWRVDKLVPERGITIIGGLAGTFKTWAAMDMAICCASGQPYLDEFGIEKCNVLYLDEENGDITLPYRFNKLINGHDLAKEEFDNLYCSIFNDIKIDTNDTISTLKLLIDKFQPKIVIIDSMVRCMIGEEDKSKDVRIVFDNLKDVFKEYQDLSFVLLHHTTKQGRGLVSLRGSGDFAAFADVILMFESSHKGFASVEIAKNRHIDMSLLPRFSFQINDSEDKEGNKSINLHYIGDQSANLDAVQACIEDMMDWIGNEGIIKLRSNEIYEKMSKLTHKRNTIYSAIKSMLSNDLISKLKRGVYIVNAPTELVDD
uniref:Putative ATPase domain containing protein n=1 Tax=viral metagenome TaxID=1070528 RepID=A0A6H1ZYZ0_9ZZZZ